MPKIIILRDDLYLFSLKFKFQNDDQDMCLLLFDFLV